MSNNIQYWQENAEFAELAKIVEMLEELQHIPPLSEEAPETVEIDGKTMIFQDLIKKYSHGICPECGRALFIWEPCFVLEMPTKEPVYLCDYPDCVHDYLINQNILKIQDEELAI